MLYLEILNDDDYDYAFLSVLQRQLCEVINYEILGWPQCYDCGGQFMNCNCEYCDECKFNYCMCETDTLKKVKDRTLDFIKTKFNNEQKLDFLSYINYNPKLNYSKLKTSLFYKNVEYRNYVEKI